MRVIMKENFLVHVAQLDRVLPSEGKGHEFDSRRGHQTENFSKNAFESKKKTCFYERHVFCIYL